MPRVVSREQDERVKSRASVKSGVSGRNVPGTTQSRKNVQTLREAHRDLAESRKNASKNAFLSVFPALNVKLALEAEVSAHCRAPAHRSTEAQMHSSTQTHFSAQTHSSTNTPASSLMKASANTLTNGTANDSTNTPG
ncbi:MAG TPA: hypothetical protein VLZ31_01850 [Microbacteriaceae bacterium]|nr:hypothetical protein [Microbacteriaceae bacterium]